MAGLARHALAQLPITNQHYSTPTAGLPVLSHTDAQPHSTLSPTTLQHSLVPTSVVLPAPKHYSGDLPLSNHFPGPTGLERTNSSPEPSMGRKRKCSVGILCTILAYLTLSTINSHANKGEFHAEEEARWINTSSSWIDRQACRWIGICGVFHIRHAGWVREGQWGEDLQEQAKVATTPSGAAGTPSYWTSGEDDSETWSEDERRLRKIPKYVYDYVPYVHLFSGEEFWPCDIADHLVHTSPYLNYTPIEDMAADRTLDNLDEINQYGRFTYLQSDDNVEERPKWLGGSQNIPSKVENTNERHGKDDVRYTRETRLARKGLEMVQDDNKRTLGQAGGHSSAPAILVVVPKENGIVDAFWFYFYSYNLGNQVLNVRFGNHVGDWEHSVVRFRNGTPDTVFLSEHNFGEAYSYSAVEKIGKRPVIYSATGTHAMYATAGVHPYVLPWGLLHDQTDKGPLWDPLLNHHAYVYNHTSRALRSSTQTPKAPISWFNFGGRWGDKIYQLSDPRQYRFAGQYHYVSGPLGPRFKNLGRHNVCQGHGKCVIKHWLGGERIKRWTEAESQDVLEPVDMADVDEETVDLPRGGGLR